ncbi:MAG: AbrB/MazE/SpoVT family DNA-binding domain-containing protein [Proteobacteria bacterium]|nr:AbrB/MazE/SpoVT family DNA-binding domain-containing protein [Pseudomonadota bacterium]
MTRIAKIFSNGGSQAVRLPAEFRFAADEVYVWRDADTGDVVLSARRPDRWDDFMTLRDRLRAVPDDFLDERHQPASRRDPFAETSG